MMDVALVMNANMMECEYDAEESEKSFGTFYRAGMGPTFGGRSSKIYIFLTLHIVFSLWVARESLLSW
jgi:hypothetical protein